MKKTILLLLVSLAVFASCAPQGNAKIESTKDSTAYSIGVLIGSQLKQMQMQTGSDVNLSTAARAIADVYNSDEDKIIDTYVYLQASQVAENAYNVDSTFDVNAIVTGLKDALNGSEFIMSENAGQYIMDYISNKSKSEENAFLAEVDKIEGISKTDNGIRYIIEQQGEGIIAEDDKVSVHYTLFDYKGDTLDSSLQRNEPLEVQLPSGVVPGFAQAIGLVGVGGKVTVWIPSELGYGETGSRGAVGPNQALKFDIEVLEILPKEETK